MSTESTPLISQSSSQYSSIPSNAPNTSPQPLSHPFKPYSHSFTTPYEIYNYCSATKALENRGSVARDHLANERTFLAYLRTSLATISTGVAITQLFRLNKVTPDKPTGGRALGMYLIVLGMIFLLFAAVRFFHCQEAMTRGVFPVTNNIAILTSVLLLVLCIAMLFLN